MTGPAKRRSKNRGAWTSAVLRELFMFAAFKKPSRLIQWDGRRRSSRGDEPLLFQVRHRNVVLRLAAVLLTALTAALLAFYFGPVQSYRVGEICSYDLRARVFFKVVNQAQTDAARDQA